jgi:hypothetical protein
VDKAAIKAERKKMKEYISSLSGLDQLRIRKNKITARMLELTGVYCRGKNRCQFS